MRRDLDDLSRQRPRVADQLERSQQRLHDARRAVDRIPEVEAATARRSQWLLHHPVELQWEADLAARLSEHTGSTEPSSTPAPELEHYEAAEFDIDLRTIDLSSRPPRFGLEDRLRRNLGIDRHPDVPEIALPSPPGHGIDGPDLGL